MLRQSAGDGMVTRSVMRPENADPVYRDTSMWAERIVEATLQQRDAQPLVDLAMRGGVDSATLQRSVNLTLDALHAHLRSAADEDGIPSVDDLSVLKNLGIADWARSRKPTWFSWGARSNWAYPDFVDRLVIGSTWNLSAFELHG